MATYIMFGNYSVEGLKSVSKSRTQEVLSVVKNLGGEVREMYALLGQNDLCFVVDLPGTADALKLSIELGKLIGVSWTSAPAISVEEFDQLATS